MNDPDPLGPAKGIMWAAVGSLFFWVIVIYVIWRWLFSEMVEDDVIS
jgi:hypothetical protein